MPTGRVCGRCQTRSRVVDRAPLYSVACFDLGWSPVPVADWTLARPRLRTNDDVISSREPRLEELVYVALFGSGMSNVICCCRVDVSMVKQSHTQDRCTRMQMYLLSRLRSFTQQQALIQQRSYMSTI